MRFIWGIIGIGIGTFIIWKSYALVRIFGHFDWAEKYFSGGLGGTYFFMKLLGIFVIIFSALYMFGVIESLFGSFGSVFTPPGN